MNRNTLLGLIDGTPVFLCDYLGEPFTRTVSTPSEKEGVSEDPRLRFQPASPPVLPCMNMWELLECTRSEKLTGIGTPAVSILWLITCAGLSLFRDEAA